MRDSSIKMQGFDNRTYWTPYEGMSGNGFEEWLRVVMARSTRIIYIGTGKIGFSELIYEMRMQESEYLPLLAKETIYPIMVVDYTGYGIASLFNSPLRGIETATVMALPDPEEREMGRNLQYMEEKISNLEARIRKVKGINSEKH